MVLSKRERYIAIGVAAAVGILALNYFFVDPLLLARAELDTKIAKTTIEVNAKSKVIKESRNKEQAWADMQKNGLRRKDASEAEGLVLGSIREWAQDAGMVLSAVKPERSEKETDFQKLTFRATGAGRMREMSWFLWRIQTAPFPVKVSDMQLSAHKEGTDELSLQIGISTAYLLPDAEKKQSAAPAREVSP